MKDNKRAKTIIEYTMPALCVGVLFLIALMLNGLWPFGDKTIDYYDMAQQAESFYHHIYDAIHGVKSFVYDPYTNLGRAVPGMKNTLSVFNLLLFCVPRHMIMECMSFLMMVKIMAGATTMYIFVKYLSPKMPYCYRLILSAGYGLCGYVLVNYTIPQWLDMYAYVPLLLMFCQIALSEGRIAGLSITLFLIAINDYYFPMLALLYIFCAGGAYTVYSFVMRRKDGQKEELFAGRFALGIILGLLMSSFTWLPDIAATFTSARFANASTEGTGIVGSYLYLLSNTTPAYLSRWFALLGLSVPASFAALSLYRDIKDKKIASVIFRLSLIAMITAQLFLESIQILTHFGSYVNYPVRNGYLIYCVICAIAAKGYKADESLDEEKKTGYDFLLAGILSVLVVAVLRKMYVNALPMSDHTVLIMTMGAMLALMLCHIFVERSKIKGKSFLTFGLWACEILMFSVIMLGKPLYESPYGNDKEQEGEYIRTADSLREDLGDDLLENAKTRRIKNSDTSLNTNYGMVMGRETLSGWTGQATYDQIDGATSLGYSSQYLRILDSGGNIFSDTLLHITGEVSLIKPDSRLYTEVATADGYGLYRNNFSLPFAIPVTDIDAITNYGGGNIELFNAFAKAIGAKEEIAQTIDAAGSYDMDGHVFTEYKTGISGKKAVYLCGGCIDSDRYNAIVSVNDVDVLVPSIKEPDNVYFPAHFNNNTLFLGVFEDETFTASVDIDASDPDGVFTPEVYSIDIDVLSKLCDDAGKDITVEMGKRSYDITFNEHVNGVLIPVPYEAGWSAEVDGFKTDITSIRGLFMYIPVTGRTLHLSYFPPYMKTGFVIAALAFMALAGFVYMTRDKEIRTCIVDRVILPVYMAAFIALAVAIYVIPLIYAAIRIIC